MAIETLGDLFRANYSMHAACRYTRKHGMKSGHGCTWKAELDIQSFLVTRGPGYPLADLPRVVMCPRCKQRELILTFKPPADGANLFRIAG